MSPKLRILFSLVGLSGMLAGCARPVTSPTQTVAVNETLSRMNDSSVAELVRFGVEFSARDATARLAQCLSLVEGLQTTPNVGLAAHVTVAQVFCPACGDPETTARMVSVTAGGNSALSSRQLISLLIQMSVENRRQQLVEQQLRERIAKARRRSANLSEESRGDRTKAKILQDKLDALLNIEQKLDERRGETKP